MRSEGREAPERQRDEVRDGARIRIAYIRDGLRRLVGLGGVAGDSVAARDTDDGHVDGDFRFLGGNLEQIDVAACDADDEGVLAG